MVFSRRKSNDGKPLRDDEKADTRSYLDGSFCSQCAAGPPSAKRQPPPYVRSLGPDERGDVEKNLVRKIDARLIPMIILMYIMNYLDRNNIAAARLGGLESDLDLVGNQYQTAVSILFVGYVLMQVPSNLYLNKVGKPSVYLPAAMVVWGVISGATAGAQNFDGIASVRFFLGFIEAAYFPGCLYFLSCWYTRRELGLRTALLSSGSLISGAFSGLIAAGITGNLDGSLGLRAWRWLFIIEGAITVIIATSAFFLLPDFPRTTTWLTDNEKELAVWRLDEDIGEDDWIDSQHQTFWGGMKLAALDIKMWILVSIILTCPGEANNQFV
jgi:MFS family permease